MLSFYNVVTPASQLLENMKYAKKLENANLISKIESIKGY